MDRHLDFSEDFVLSSGTVPIDISKGLVLLLYYRPKGEYMLPKGRKNVGETLEAAAMRETTEESGFKCRLFKHQLLTNAQELVDSYHTEPIAVQQRMNRDVRKIIFWYIAEVDSSSQRMSDTQEEGEDFDVEWVCIENAPSKCSFDDDRKILAKALEAVRRAPLASIPPVHEARNAYLDATVDRQALGFLSISLGGSIVKQQTGATFCEPAANKDWDGFGILETKASIVRLIRDFRAELCVMLRIEKEECPSLRLPEDPMLGMQWDVLRFSGWTSEGSKRTIKLWSKESFEREVSTSNSSHLGLLSHKVRRFFECSDPEHGSRLHIYQPVRAMEDLYILCDFDFLQGTTSEPVAFSNTAMSTPFSPGVSFDLFLTSLCLFEYEPGFIASVKAAIIRKWQLLSRSPESLSIIAFLYRTEAISSAYKSNLRAEIREMNIKGADACSFSDSSAAALKTQASGDMTGYRNLILSPLCPQKHNASVRNDSLRPATAPYPKALVVHYDLMKFSSTPFSSNSSGQYADIKVGRNQSWQQVYIKNSTSSLHEVKVFARVRQYFPAEAIQTILAVDEENKTVSFKRFQGQTLNEIRLRYYHGQSPFHISLKQPQYRIEQWFIDLDLRRASDVLAAYQKSFRLVSSGSCSEQKIHDFYHERLLHNRRFKDFYGTCSFSFLDGTLGCCMPFEEILDIPISINGQSHGTLRHQLDRATLLLDPHRAEGLQSLPIAFGFGDGHGGNVMVSLDMDSPSLLYVDYEVTGYHTPFLDLAKPIYMDGFFNAAYADLIYEWLPRETDKRDIWIDWTINKGHLSIDYNFTLEPLWKAIANIKLEYVLRPVFEMLEKLAPSQRDTAEETLACGLFCCALLSRNYSKRPDIFCLNLALGMRLATEMKAVFSECFGWNNWPPRSFDKTASLPRTRPEQENRQLVVVNKERISLHDSRLDQIKDSSHGSFDRRSHDTVVDLFRDNVEDHRAGLPFRWRIDQALDVEAVFLKREEDTVALHKRFSTRADEGNSMISRRIHNVRRSAMRIAPFTCISECLFAESRIGRHFKYPLVLADGRAGKETLIDVGCCMGTDIRTLIADGYPAHNITGLDREIRFIQLGYTLYNHRPQDLDTRFLEADVLDPNFSSKCAHLAAAFDSVHSANVIHLFDETQQETFIRSLAFLVKPGGTVWGRQVGLVDGEGKSHWKRPEGKGTRFSMQGFRRLWVRANGWDERAMRFEAVLVPYEELRTRRADKGVVLQWAVSKPVGGRIVDEG